MPTDSGTRIRLPHKVDVTDFLVVAEVVAEASVTVIAVVAVNVFCCFFLLFMGSGRIGDNNL